MALAEATRGWDAIRRAYDEPAEVADSWRASGGKVVGVLGRSVPSELIMAAGMLPLRIAPRRLGRDGAALDPAVASLMSELSPPGVRVLGALRSGQLDWIDALVIGRDSEADTRLFYLLREMTLSGDAEALPPLAFFDLLRLPQRPSSRYNRSECQRLLGTIEAWAKRKVDDADLQEASDRNRGDTAMIRALTSGRAYPEPICSGSDALMVAGAAQILPSVELRKVVNELGGSNEPPLPGPSPAVFVTGSGLDDLTLYRALEVTGIQVVGEDHEWGGAPLASEGRAGGDPLDDIVQRYQHDLAISSRTGLAERCRHTVEEALGAGAQAVLQVVFDHDDASAWELPLLTELLAPPGIPVVQVRLHYDNIDETAIADVASRLRTVTGHG